MFPSTAPSGCQAPEAPEPAPSPEGEPGKREKGQRGLPTVPLRFPGDGCPPCLRDLMLSPALPTPLADSGGSCPCLPGAGATPAAWTGACVQSSA